MMLRQTASKKLTALILAALMIAGILLVSPVTAGAQENSATAVSAYITGTYKVNTETDPLRMRSEPSLTATVIANVPKGTIVTITEIQNDFGKTTYGGKTGWLSMTYLLKVTDNSSNQSSGLGTYKITTQGGRLNFRSAPEATATVYFSIPNGTVVVITEISNGYGKTTYDGKTGWLSMTYLVKVTDNNDSSNQSSDLGTYKITTQGGRLNFRSAPDATASVYFSIPNGTTVVITEISNGYGKTTYDGKTGWLSMTYLVKVTDNNDSSNQSSGLGTYKITTQGGRLNFRSAPNATASVYFSIPNGTVVVITEISNGYGKTTYDGKTGWLSMSYLIAVSSDQSDNKVGKYQVTTKEGNLILRSEASPSGSILALVSKGTIVTITEFSNGYGKTVYNAKTGWLSLDYLTYVDDSASNTEGNGLGTYVITTQGGRLNFRSAPDTSASVYFSIPNGTRVVITDISNDFGKTTYNGQTGWLSMRYLVYVSSDGTNSGTLPSDTAGSYKVTTNGGKLILREDASSLSSQLALIPNGTVLKIAEIKNGYGKTTYNGTVGWVSMNYVVKTDQTESATVSGKYKVTTQEGSLTLRSQPTTSSTALGYLPKGTVVTITEVQNGFGKTTYNGQTGWLSMNYLTPTDDSDEAETRLGSYEVATNSGSLTLRSIPSTSGDKLDYLPKGTIVYVTEIRDGWAKTTYDGKTGWLSMAYLKFVSSDNISTDAEQSTYKQGSYKVTTNGGNLILRSTPITGTQLALIPNGTPLVISEFSGTWGKTTYNGQTGWVSMDWVTFVSSTSDDSDMGGYTLGKYNVTLTSGTLRLRSQPSTSSETLAAIPNGTELLITEISNGWGKTTYGGKTGWVSMSYLTPVKSSTPDSDKEVTTDTSDNDIIVDDILVEYVVTTTGADASIYEEATTSSSILGTVSNGTTVFTSKVEGDWAYIVYDDIRGYIRLDQLTAASVVNGSEPEVVYDKVFSINTLDTAGVVNLHAEKSIFSETIGKIPNGTIVYVQEVSGAWAKITYGGKTGWILKTFLTRGDEEVMNGLDDNISLKGDISDTDYEELINDVVDEIGNSSGDSEVDGNDVVMNDDNINGGEAEIVGGDDYEQDENFNGEDEEIAFGEDMYGDVDCNGRIDMEDVVLYQKVIAELTDMSRQGAINADVDGNGKCNLEDVVYIQRYIARLIEKFPAEG